MKILRKLSKAQLIFLFLIAVISLGVAVAILLSRGELLRLMLWNGDDLGGIVPDFFQSIGSSAGRKPYDSYSIYPPMAYLLCYLLGTFIPGFADGVSWISFSKSHAGVTVYLLFTVICAAVIFACIAHNWNSEGIVKTFFIAFILISEPFLYCIERGNFVLLSVACILVFLSLYDSPDKLLRHIGLLFLAFAAAIKIYPAIFGLLVIKKGRLKETISLIAYGLVMFFTPFVFFGGIPAVKKLFDNIIHHTSTMSVDKQNFGYQFKIGISDFMKFTEKLTGVNISSASAYAVIFFAVILLAAFIMCRSDWKKASALGLACALLLNFSFVYNILYILPAFALFMKNSKNTDSDAPKINIFYGILFIIMFAACPFGKISLPENTVNQTTYLIFTSTLPLIVMSVTLFADGIIDTVKRNMIKSVKIKVFEGPDQ